MFTINFETEKDNAIGQLKHWCSLPDLPLAYELRVLENTQ
jgi:hypothetical protein